MCDEPSIALLRTDAHLEQPCDVLHNSYKYKYILNAIETDKSTPVVHARKKEYITLEKRTLRRHWPHGHGSNISSSRMAHGSTVL